MKTKILLVLVIVLLMALTAGVSLAQTRDGYSNFTSVGVSNFLTTSPASTVTLTNGGTLTPSASVMPVTAAGGVTVTLAVVDTAGQTPLAGTQLTVYNTVAQSIVISETATAQMSGNQTLGQYDAIHFIFDGTRWIETGESDN